MNILEAWEKSQGQIKKEVGDTSYETWLSTLQVNETAHDTLTIETPDDFFKNWIVDHYQNLIEKALSQNFTGSCNLEFVVNTQTLNKQTQKEVTRIDQIINEKAPIKSSLNTRFTFDNFVIGSSNRFACAASLAVAESPAKAYNPLFIYGQVGLGKTHLIQAITHNIQQTQPHLKICYLSSEKFTNELIDSIRHRSTTDFRKKYREIDVLLIDDIHFIAGKESTQEEFFHTFNFLHDNHKQIIITSDRPPREISNLEERLSSRFAWGLITDVQPPDFETRVAILRKKMEAETTVVPSEVINFIAEQIKTNIRELEGALIRVIAYSSLEDKPVSLESSKRILKDMVKESTKAITVEMIQKSVSNHYQVSLTDLRAKKRNKNIVLARQVAMYLSRELAKMSYPEIGSAFGGKDHTTVLHSCKKIERETKDNSQLKNTIEDLSTGLLR